MSINEGQSIGGETGNGGNTNRRVKKKRKKVPTYKGEGTLGYVAPDPNGKNIKFSGLRISSISEDAKKAIINFTSPEEVKDRPIILYKKGETDATEILDINGTNTYSGKKGERIRGIEFF